MNVHDKIVRNRLSKIMKVLLNNVNQTEMEWLQLCNVAASLKKHAGPPGIKPENVKQEESEQSINEKEMFLHVEASPSSMVQVVKQDEEEFDSD